MRTDFEHRCKSQIHIKSNIYFDTSYNIYAIIELNIFFCTRNRVLLVNINLKYT